MLPQNPYIWLYSFLLGAHFHENKEKEIVMLSNSKIHVLNEEILDNENSSQIKQKN